NDSAEAFLVTGKRPAREAAVVLHRVPAALDAAHVGFVFTDVIGNGHYGARTCMASAFDERQAAVGSAQMPGSGCTHSRTQLHLMLFGAVIVPADGTRAATLETRRLRYVAA